MRSLRLAVAVALTLGAVGAGAQPTVYFNDFEANTAGITGAVSRVAYPAGCTSAIVGCPGFYLGAGDGNPFRLGQTFSVNLAALPTHTGLRLSFDYLVLHSMDGAGLPFGFGPDGLMVAGDATTLINATFSNWPSNLQSYCPPTGIGGANLCARWTGATEVNTLGYVFQGDVGSSLYRLTFDLTHSAPGAAFTFTALTNQDWSDEGMGFDNIRVQALGVPTPGVVPEPSTYALMATGLLALGGVARRRRQG